MLETIKRQWFLIGLIIAVSLPALFSGSLHEIAEQAWLRWTIVATVMFVMALPLELRQIWNAIQKPQ